MTLRSRCVPVISDEASLEIHIRDAERQPGWRVLKFKKIHFFGEGGFCFSRFPPTERDAGLGETAA